MTVRVFISGFVQGVGFRQFILRQAQDLRLTGWVKNLPASPASPRGEPQGGPDNRVEAVFQGSKEQINKMIIICRKGTFLSEVKDVNVIWEENSSEDTTYKTFEVVS